MGGAAVPGGSARPMIGRARMDGTVARARGGRVGGGLTLCGLRIANRRMRPGPPCLLVPQCDCRCTPVLTPAPAQGGGRGGRVSVVGQARGCARGQRRPQRPS
jgi:hypothetical protein